MTLLRPLPRLVTGPASALILIGWVVQMGVLVREAYLQSTPVSLAGQIAGYGAAAQWRGVYYRGEKIGFVVGDTVQTEDGFELREDGQLQMTLMGVTTPAVMSTRVLVDRAFGVRSFDFSLDPGTGAIRVHGSLDGLRLELSVTTPGGQTRTETRDLPEPPMLNLNLPRRLAAEGLATGKRFEMFVFDPATLANAPMILEVGEREVVRAAGRPVPAFRVRTRFAGISATTWLTDVGEVVKEESPLGLVVLRESRERAIAMSLPRDVRSDMIQAAAIVPTTRTPIDDPASVEYLRLRVSGVDLARPELQGAGQRVEGDVVEIAISEKAIAPEPVPPDLDRYLVAEPFIDSDAPEIVAEAAKAVGDARDASTRAERLVRYVNALLEKKPTVSLPSASEVLRTKVGDCNEHTVLYVAMARASGIPARISVGLVYLRGAFFYHAWPEVFVSGPVGQGRWLPVDPTLNQFPADGTHLRLARGGLEQQASILPVLGTGHIDVLEVRTLPGTTPILVGRDLQAGQMPVLVPERSRSTTGSCWTWGDGR